MKRFSNLLLYGVLCPEILYALYLWFSGERAGWTSQFFIVAFVLVLAAYVMNVVDRYSAMKVFSVGTERYQFVVDAKLGSAALRWSNMTFAVGIPLAMLVGLFFLFTLPDTQKTGIVLCFSSVEKLFFFVYSRSKNYFRAGMNDQALVINNGGLQVIPFAGLKAIESKYDELLFVYGEKDIRSTYRFLTEEGKQEEFFQQLEKVAKAKDIPADIRRL